MKILCLTPVKHLNDIYNSLESFCGGKHLDYRPQFVSEDFTYWLSSYRDLSDYDVIFCNPNKQNYVLDETILSTFRGVILTASTGLNHIDVDYCNENGIKVLSHKDDYDLLNDLPSTSELAFGLMISLMRNIPSGYNHVKSGGWDYEPYVGHQIKGKTIGVIGYGRLGKIMCDLFSGWGVKLLASDPYERITTARGVPLDELLEKSDVVFLHTHVTDETRGMVDDEFLSQMKQGSYLINTSRGELVDEDAIIESIKVGHLKGYGTDVIKDEFGDIKNSKLVEFSKSNNVLITPHVGGMTWEGQQRAYEWSINKLREL